MSIWRATLRILKEKPLPFACEDGDEVQDIIARMLQMPGSTWTSVEEALSVLFSLEREGSLSLHGSEESSELAEIRQLVDVLDAHLRRDPGLNNVVGDHRAWQDDPAHYDFVSKDTELGRLKRFERDLYLDILSPYLDTLPEEAHLLDAGCGPGRFVAPMLSRSFKVHLVDASKDALHRALQQGLDSGGHAENLDGHVADIDALEIFKDEHFDATLSMEVVCYRGEPLRALKELTRVTKIGGLVMLSVEGVYGAMMVTEGASPGEIDEALEREGVSMYGDVHVSYFTEASLRDLMIEAGLLPLHIQGSHYVTEGPFSRAVDLERVDQEEHQEEIIRLERRCQSDPALRPLARAWVGIGRRT